MLFEIIETDVNTFCTVFYILLLFWKHGTTFGKNIFLIIFSPQRPFYGNFEKQLLFFSRANNSRNVVKESFFHFCCWHFFPLQTLCQFRQQAYVQLLPERMHPTSILSTY